MDKDLRISALEAQVDRLAMRVDDLERALFGTGPLDPPEWRLTFSESRLFAVLVHREFVSKEAALVALYDDTLRDRAEPKIVDVFICKLRKKLAKLGVRIETHWGKGYSLANRDRYRRAS